MKNIKKLSTQQTKEICPIANSVFLNTYAKKIKDEEGVEKIQIYGKANLLGIICNIPISLYCGLNAFIKSFIEQLSFSWNKPLYKTFYLNREWEKEKYKKYIKFFE
jgi:hypothetical protein